MWEEQLLNEASIFIFFVYLFPNAEKLDKVLFLSFLFWMLSMERKLWVFGNSLGWKIWSYVFLWKMLFFLLFIMPSFVKRWLLYWVFILLGFSNFSFLWLAILFVIDFETKFDYVGASKGFSRFLGSYTDTIFSLEYNFWNKLWSQFFYFYVFFIYRLSLIQIQIWTILFTFKINKYQENIALLLHRGQALLRITHRRIQALWKIC